MINQTRNGRWRVRVKSGGAVVADKTFDLKRHAEAWERDQKVRLTDGTWVDPRRGKASVQSAIDRWLMLRASDVSGKTFQTDEYLLRVHTSKKFAARPIGAVDVSEVKALLREISMKGLSSASVRRYRATLSALFSEAVEEGMIRYNPVLKAKLAKGDGTEIRHEVFPFPIKLLREVYEAQRGRNPAQADLTMVLALTGIRWGELVSLRVRDVQQVPYPSLRISRSGPDGHEIRTKTKGGGPRTVPIANEILPLIEFRTKNRLPDELLFTAPEGGRLNANNWRRTVDWPQTGHGRRVHDLRHTAATLWLNSGIDVKTVQTWLGHASITLTVDLYGHFLGQDADRAGMARLNAALGDATGTPTLTAVNAGIAIDE